MLSRNIGVHQLRNFQGSSSFFVERPFGNYVFYADLLVDDSYEFFKSRGGVHRIFLSSTADINNQHIRMFNRLGCYAVITDDFAKDTHNDIPVEKNLQDFKDPSLYWNSYPGINSLMVKQKGKNILFMGKEVRLDSESKVRKGTEDITEPIFQFAREQNLFMIFFCRHEGHATLTTDLSLASFAFGAQGYLSQLLKKITKPK